MTRKSTSLVMAIATIYLFFQGLTQPNDPLFMIVSANAAINLGLVLLVGFMVWVSFLEKFKHWQLYVITAALSVFLGFVGLMGVMFTSLNYYLSSVLLPLDFLVLLEVGIGLGICALSYRHEPIPSQRYKLPQTNNWLPKPRLQQPRGPRPRAI
jgi:hypothetical protein